MLHILHINSYIHHKSKIIEKQQTCKSLLHKYEQKALRFLSFPSLPHPAGCSCPRPHAQRCYLFNPLWACFNKESKSRSSNLVPAGDRSSSWFASEEEKDVYRSTVLSKSCDSDYSSATSPTIKATFVKITIFNYC